MNKISIDWLGNWFRANKTLTDNLSADVKLFVENNATDNPAQSYDLETSSYFARIILWASGECDIDAVSKVNPGEISGSDRFFAHRTINSEAELDVFLRKFVELL